MKDEVGKKAIKGAIQRLEGQANLANSIKKEAPSNGLVLHWGNWSNWANFSDGSAQ